jgi:hypothetical protein
MNAKMSVSAVVGVLAVAVAIVAPGGESSTRASASAARGGCALPRGGEQIDLVPANFTTRIDNPYWPMKPGNRWVYRETDPEGARQKVVVTVTSKTKQIANGITARVVHDAVTDEGSPVEVTDDFYAQDRAGNIWYLGEDTKEYENGRVSSTSGSFEAGVDGAQAGVVMPARPRVGLSYRQEYRKGEAEDRASIFSLKEQVEVPFGHFRKGRVLMTRDVNPLEPKVLEYKFYARGVGPVLAIGVSGDNDREELLSYSRGR